MVDRGDPGGRALVEARVGNFPATQADNDAAAELLHPEVGKYVALGGGANPLTEAVTRLSRVMGISEEPVGDSEALRTRSALVTERPKALRGYKGLHLPRQRTDERARPVRAPDEVPVSVASDVESRNAGRSASAHASSGHGKSSRSRAR